MTQTDIEVSNDEGEITDTSISDGESDLENLRQSAILSMIKTEKIPCEGIELPVCTVFEIEKQLKACRESIANENISDFQLNKRSTFISSQKRLHFDDVHVETKRIKKSEVVQLVEKYVGKPLSDMVWEGNISKQREIKDKLIEILKETPKGPSLIKNDTKVNPKPKFILNINCDDQEKSSVCTNEMEIFEPYSSNINEEEKSINEIANSINTMNTSIREKLQKSKDITIQIENLKQQKIDLHKGINETRSKISYLHKIKKQKLVNLAKFKNLRKQYELSPVSSFNIEKSDTLSIASFEIEESHNNNLDCNQIICTSWIHDTCTNKHCTYQHPKIAVTPVAIQRVPIKENDKVFLLEMNPLEFIATFQCDACSSLVHLSNLHIVDDWHCTSCCQQIMTLTRPADILRQLITIWHHVYKRYIMSQQIAVENRSTTVLDSLVKCTEALHAKLISLSGIDPDLMRSVSRHILIVFCESGRSNDCLNFIKAMNYDVNLVRFVTTLQISVVSVHQLIVDVIDLQIDKGSFDDIETLIQLHHRWCEYLELSPVPVLFQWLEKAVKRDIARNYATVIDILTKILLIDIGSCTAHVLEFSFLEFDKSEHYWSDRRINLARLVHLCDCNGESQSSLCLVLIKYKILSLFFSDYEESAIELCRQYTGAHFYFQILLSKLSLKYNYPISMNECNVEHSYNKSEWLLQNRSEKSCIKVLENIARSLYRNTSVDIDPLRLYQHLLSLDKQFDTVISILVPNFSDSDALNLRQSSSIWMCYVSLSALSGQYHNMTDLLHTDLLLQLDSNHLSRIAEHILTQFAIIYESEQYLEKLKLVFVRVKSGVCGTHFMALCRCVSFSKLGDYQLPMWLFLLDLCVDSEESKSLFLREMCPPDSYDILSHIVLCYQPIDVEKVWLHLIGLILCLNLPLHTLMDVCRSATVTVRWSQALWRHYYNCAFKAADQRLVDDVYEKAARMGFTLR